MQYAVSIAVFVLLALIASYVQSVTGFALGMIMMAVAGGLDWYPIATLA